MHEASQAPTLVYTSPAMCEDVELADIDYLAASNPQEAAMRSLRFCEVTHENGCSLEEIAITEAERDRAALLDSNAQCGYEVHLLEITLYSVALLLIFAVLFTNLLLVLVIIRYQTLRTSTNKLILSLAISDTVFALSSIYSEVMNILQSAAEMNYNYARLEQIITVRSIKQLCLLLDGPGLIYASMMASVLTLTCIASEKYIAIFHPFQYYRIVTNRNIVISAACIWVFAILFGLTPLVWNTFDGTCSMTEKTAYGYMLLWTCICLACAILMLTLYIRIFLIAHRQARAIHARQTMFTDDKTHAPSGIGTGKRSAPSKLRSTSKSKGKSKIVSDMFMSSYDVGNYTSKHEVELPSLYQAVSDKLTAPDSNVGEKKLNVYSLANRNLQSFDSTCVNQKSRNSGFYTMDIAQDTLTDTGTVNEKVNAPVTLNVTLNGLSNPITITVSNTDQISNSDVPKRRLCEQVTSVHSSSNDKQLGNMQPLQLDKNNSDLVGFEICDSKLENSVQSGKIGKSGSLKQNTVAVRYTCNLNESHSEVKSKTDQLDYTGGKLHHKGEATCCFSKRYGSIESQNMPLINSSESISETREVSLEMTSPRKDMTSSNTSRTSQLTTDNSITELTGKSRTNTENSSAIIKQDTNFLQDDIFSQADMSLKRNISSKDIVLQTEQELVNTKPECDTKINSLCEINVPMKKLSVIAETNDEVARKLSLLSPLKDTQARKIINPLKPLRRVSTEPTLNTKLLDESVRDKSHVRSALEKNKVAPFRRMNTVIGIFPQHSAGTSSTDAAQPRRSTSKSIFTHKIFPPSLRAVKTIAIILGAFYVCWLPLLIYILAFKDRYSNFTINVLAMLALINSLLNPLIYGFKNKGIRTAMRRMVTCGRSKRRCSDTGPSLPYDTAYQLNH